MPHHPDDLWMTSDYTCAHLTGSAPNSSGTSVSKIGDARPAHTSQACHTQCTSGVCSCAFLLVFNKPSAITKGHTVIQSPIALTTTHTVVLVSLVTTTAEVVGRKNSHAASKSRSRSSGSGWPDIGHTSRRIESMCRITVPHGRTGACCLQTGHFMPLSFRADASTTRAEYPSPQPLPHQ